jgi:hypothetical protein
VALAVGVAVVVDGGEGGVVVVAVAVAVSVARAVARAVVRAVARAVARALVGGSSFLTNY